MFVNQKKHPHHTHVINSDLPKFSTKYPCFKWSLSLKGKEDDVFLGGDFPRALLKCSEQLS